MKENNNEIEELIDDIKAGETHTKINGINKKALIEFIKQLIKQPIDFSTIPIEWIIYYSLNGFLEEDSINITMIDLIVDEVTFEYLCEEDFNKVNPILYKLICEAAKQVTEKAITFESKKEYLEKKIKKGKKEEEKIYYKNLLKIIEEKKDSKSKN